MKALIDPRENRVCEVSKYDFPVAYPLMWVDCDETVTPENTIYVNGDFVQIPKPEQPQIVEPSKSDLLAQIQSLAAKVEALP